MELEPLHRTFQVERPVLLVGDTGTSKTAIITNYLRGLPPDKYVSAMNLYEVNRYVYSYMFCYILLPYFE